jgi:hypothetical protein
VFPTAAGGIAPRVRPPTEKAVAAGLGVTDAAAAADRAVAAAGAAGVAAAQGRVPRAACNEAAEAAVLPTAAGGIAPRVRRLTEKAAAAGLGVTAAAAAAARAVAVSGVAATQGRAAHAAGNEAAGAAAAAVLPRAAGGIAPRVRRLTEKAAAAGLGSADVAPEADPEATSSEWRPFPADTHYVCSEPGEVRHAKGTTPLKGFYPGGTRHPMVRLGPRGRGANWRVSHVVAACWVPNGERVLATDTPVEVVHIDGNPQNNAACNLEVQVHARGTRGRAV